MSPLFPELANGEIVYDTIKPGGELGISIKSLSQSIRMIAGVLSTSHSFIGAPVSGCRTVSPSAGFTLIFSVIILPLNSQGAFLDHSCQLKFCGYNHPSLRQNIYAKNANTIIVTLTGD